jgi:proteasome lid subunit RPN8/RPN11
VIVLPAREREALLADCVARYPEEACGLLIGRRDDAAVVVTGVAPSPNRSPMPRTSFEIDAKLRLDLARALRGGPTGVVGLYHSHPDGGAEPSATDRDRAWEPDLVWLIVALERGRVAALAAHALGPAGAAPAFRSIAIAGEPRTPV